MPDTPLEQIFEDQTVLITGAAGGFGRSVSRLFAERGAKLVLSDFNEKGLSDQAANLREDGFEVATLAGSVADESHCFETVELALESYGRLDVAINNAGIGHDPAKLPFVDSEQAQKTIQVDLMGVFYCMKHQIPVMEKANAEHGRVSNILNIASLAGIGGAPLVSMYAAAKHGVIGLTKTAALEYARRGIRINALCPAFARTPMVEEDLLGDAIKGGAKPKDAEANLTRGIPMRRLAEPEEITRSMLWICDPRNTFMTGQAVALDGGTSAM